MKTSENAQAILDLAECRLRDSRVTDGNVRHDLGEIVRLATRLIDGLARCPSCDSSSPSLHPAVQHEGEVRVCRDAFHFSWSVDEHGNECLVTAWGIFYGRSKIEALRKSEVCGQASPNQPYFTCELHPSHDGSHQVSTGNRIGNVRWPKERENG